MNVSGATIASVARGQTGRARRAWSQLWQAPTFLLGLVAILCVAASSSYRAELRESPFRTELRSLRQGIGEASNYHELVVRAEAALAQTERYPRLVGEAHFLAGSAYFRLAESANHDVIARARALEHLEAALAIGVSDGDLPAARYRLGVLLYRAGMDRERGLDLMIQGADRGSDRPAQAYALLAEAYLTATPPDLDAALSASQKMLELADEPEMLGQARYLRAELLQRKGQRLEALKELDRIVAEVSRDRYVKTRLFQAQLCEAEGLWNRAASIWKGLLDQATDVPGGKGRVLLAYGHSLANAEPPLFREAGAAWQDALALGGKEAQAAGLHLGELRLHVTPDEPNPALVAWSEALRSIRYPADWKNPYLSAAEARLVFERGCRHFMERGDFEHAQQAAELYKKLAAAGAAELHWAHAVEAQAREWQEAATGDNPPARALRDKAREWFGKAGRTYEQVAADGPDDQRLDPQWRSAQCYLAAQDLPRAAVVLQRFVTHAKDEARLAEAWFALAQAQAAQKRSDAARQAYYKCMEFPATKFASRARFQLALEEIERKNFDDAKTILKQNLVADRSSLDRETHEKSLYKMAGLLLQLREFDEAAWHLKEAARQYPNNTNALYARDRLADCYRVLADRTHQKIKELEGVKYSGLTPERAAALEELRAYQQRTRRQWLEQAVAVYQNLADELQRKALAKPLSADEAVVLRRAAFGVADRQFELGNFSEALRHYQMLQRAYARQVEGLIACNHIWRCVGVMVESPAQMKLAREACQNAVRQARADLDAMPAESPAFQGEGVWSRGNWLTWLDWVQSQLNPPATVNRPNPLVN